MSPRHLLATTQLFLLALLAAPALGGAEAPCVSFGIYEGARVNTLVRQFVVLDNPRSPLSAAGMQLTRMVQLDALHSQIGFGPLGCIYLRVEPRDAQHCSNEFILERARSMSSANQGLILLSGYFQEVDGEIFLMTELEFSRKDREESLLFQVPSRGPDRIEFFGQLPVTRVSFSPRQFSVRQLEHLVRKLEQPLVLYPQPQGEGQAIVLSLEELENFWYSVQRVDGSWMQIRSADGRREGWIEVPQAVDLQPLRTLLPELYAVQAAAIYLQSRIAGETLGPEQRVRNVRAMERALNQFQRHAQPGGDQHAIGMLEAMLGGMQLEGGGTAAELQSAREHFAKSAEALPANASALSLRAVSAVLDSSDPDPVTVTERFEQNLLRLLRLDPQNSTIRANLEQLYLLREQSDQSMLVPQRAAALRERLQMDPQVQAKIKRQ